MPYPYCLPRHKRTRFAPTITDSSSCLQLDRPPQWLVPSVRTQHWIMRASAEVTSEEKSYGIESALLSGEAQGWRAASPGTQTIRLLFDQPQKRKRISLVFEETDTERTQEFVLRWSGDGGRSFREIVRQQWNFSFPNSIREVDKYQVQLSDVTVLELVTVPDISRGTARASPNSLRLA